MLSVPFSLVQDVFTMGVKACEKAFKKTYGDCKDKVKVPGLNSFICSPLKLDGLCKLVRGKKHCLFSGNIFLRLSHKDFIKSTLAKTGELKLVEI